MKATKENILENNNVCLCYAQNFYNDIETRRCFMSCGKRQDLTLEEMNDILDKNH